MIKNISILFYLVSLSMLLLSAIKMHWYLVDKGKEKSKLYSFNMFLFIDYMTESEKEFGKPGKWLSYFLISFVTTLFLTVVVIVANAKNW